jgi:hypothetical protein
MIHARCFIGLLAAAFTLCAVDGLGQELTIRVKTTWKGLGTTKGQITDVLISGDHGKYRLNGKKVEAARVEAFLTALDEPSRDTPSLENCGITSAWLQNNYMEALKSAAPLKVSSLSPAQIELFRSHFTDLVRAQESLKKMFQSIHTDDYPMINLEISRKGEPDFREVSASQNPFMLPWAGAGYNCRVSQALASLLPAEAVNRARLVIGDHFRAQLAAVVMRDIRKEWDRLDTDWRIGRDIAPVRNRFEVLETRLARISSIDSNGEYGWNAMLSAPRLQPRWVVGVTLYLDSKNRLPMVDRFLQRIDAYIDLAQSVPWLSAYTRDHRDVGIELRYVQDRSLSDKVFENLARNLRQNGKSALADRVIRDRDESVFLEVQESGQWSRWIVFPNREMLLWHFKSESTLGFKADDMKLWDYLGWHGAGVLVTADGVMIP